MPPRWSVPLTIAGVSAILFGLAGSPPSARATHDCGLPDEQPLWIDYGQGSVPPEVREVLARPGIVLAASGTMLPNTYRVRGAATVHFELNLPRAVGTPGTPAAAEGIVGAADAMFDRAVASTQCETPWIGLNELNGPAAPTPWSPTTAQYRANVLALLARLSERGSRPVLFVHGNPNVAGEAAAWWREVGSVAHIAYEAYYNAVRLDALGRIVGPRRIRLGMRAAIRRFTSVGVAPGRIGLVLGFQVGQGKMGREGLQPRENWFRVVKWNTLAAKQVATELGLATVWSWGWGTFGAASADPDKPVAACVHLWSRDPALCDAPAAAGPAFNRSRVEGVILIPDGVRCISAAGRLGEAVVDGLVRLTGDARAGLDAAFTRLTLRKRAPVSTDEILAVESDAIARAFAGSNDAYLAALAERNVTLAIARGVIGDELRRGRLAVQLEPGQTVLGSIADTVSAELDTATCVGDELPGSGDFPRSDQREVPAVPLASFLPFLFDDTTPPAPPQGALAAVEEGGVRLDWADSPEADLAGYDVYRLDPTGGEPALLTSAPLTRSTFLDDEVADGATVVYVVRAVDTSLNASDPSAEVTVLFGPVTDGT
jgi:hypothetical protein